MLVAHGHYTGDGSDSRNITDLDGSGSGTAIGFDPTGQSSVLVLVKRVSGSGGSFEAIFKTSAMAGDTAKQLGSDAAFASDCIQAFVSGGFQVGTDARVNNSGDSYQWVMLADGGEADFKVGTFTGNGTDNHDITGVGFQPNNVWVWRDEVAPIWALTSDMGADSTWVLNAFGSAISDRVQAFGADGFQVGSHDRVNASGVTIYYVAWKDDPGVAVTTSYTGNGSDDRDLSSLGLTPDAFAMTRRLGSEGPVLRFGDQSGDNSENYNSGALSNKIQAFISGGIQVGTGSGVNTSSATYVVWLFADNAAAGISGTMAATVQSPKFNGVGGQTQSGVLSASLQNAVFNATGVMLPAGAILATLQLLAFSASGGQTSEGLIEASLQGPLFAGTGVMLPSGVLAAMLQEAAFNASGAQNQAGELTATVQSPKFNAEGAQTFAGALAAALQQPVFNASGGQTIAGTLEAVLQPSRFNASGAQLVAGVLTASLQTVLFDATGAMLPAGVLAAYLQQLAFNGTGLADVIDQLIVYLRGGDQAVFLARGGDDILKRLLAGDEPLNRTPGGDEPLMRLPGGDEPRAEA